MDNCQTIKLLVNNYKRWLCEESFKTPLLMTHFIFEFRGKPSLITVFYMDPHSPNNIVFSYSGMITGFFFFISLFFVFLLFYVIFYKNYFIIIILFYYYFCRKIIFIFPCSEMFRHVPECSVFRGVPYSATQPFLVSSRNAPPFGEERCVTTLKTAV